MSSLLPIPVKVLQRRMELADTVTLSLPAGIGSPAPGQFYMLHAFGVGEVPISLSAIGGAEHEFTVRSVGAVSQALTKRAAGDRVGVRGPFGSSWPVGASSGKDILLIAGGLGIAPLRPMLAEIAANRAHYGSVTLLYGAHSPGELLFEQQLASWGRDARIDVRRTVDIARPDWQGAVGVVTSLVGKIALDPGKTTAMVCGPEIMMRFSVRELMRRGVPPSRILLSLERNMHCALAHCGRCMLGPHFVCKDGPIFPYDKISRFFETREM